MVTNYPQSIAAHRGTSPGETFAEGFGGRVLDRLRQAVCGLHGHDALVQFEHDRMYLRCVSCGHETHGWELNDTRPVATMHVEARRKPLAAPQLIGERKIA